MEKKESAKKEPIKIEGSIKYILTESEDGDWNIQYESSIENDIVCLAAAENISNTITEGLRPMVKLEKTTRDKKRLKGLIEKGTAARFGLKMLIDYMQPIYRSYRDKTQNKDKSNEA